MKRREGARRAGEKDVEERSPDTTSSAVFFGNPDSWTDCLYSNTLLCRTPFFLFFPHPRHTHTHTVSPPPFLVRLFKHLSSATIYLSASSSRLFHQLALSLSSDYLLSLQFPSSLNLTCLVDFLRSYKTRHGSLVCFFSYHMDSNKSSDFPLNASSAAVDV